MNKFKLCLIVFGLVFCSFIKEVSAGATICSCQYWNFSKVVYINPEGKIISEEGSKNSSVGLEFLEEYNVLSVGANNEGKTVLSLLFCEDIKEIINLLHACRVTYKQLAKFLLIGNAGEVEKISEIVKILIGIFKSYKDVKFYLLSDELILDYIENTLLYIAIGIENTEVYTVVGIFEEALKEYNFNVEQINEFLNNLSQKVEKIERLDGAKHHAMVGYLRGRVRDVLMHEKC